MRIFFAKLKQFSCIACVTVVLHYVFQEWPEEDYPPYANGPGYILSSDIAHFIVSEFEKRKLRVGNGSSLSLSLFL